MRRARTQHWKDGKCCVCGTAGKVSERASKCADCFHTRLSKCFFCNDWLERRDSAPLVRGASTALRICWGCERKYPHPCLQAMKGSRRSARHAVLSGHLAALKARQDPQEAELREGLERELADATPAPAYQEKTLDRDRHVGLLEYWIDFGGDSAQARKWANLRYLRTFYLRRKRARELAKGAS